MKNQHLVLLGFLLLAVALRFCSFFPSVINHDESTYLVIGNALSKGHIYFIDYIDTKPVGIFTLIASFQLVFGKSIILFRFFAACCLALTAYLLFLIQRQWDLPPQVGIASGVIYLVMNSLYTFYGISPNTELFFNLFTALGLYLILRRNGGWEYLAAGLAMGFGFLIKYVVAFDALAFGLFLLIEAVQQKQAWQQFIGRASLLIIGFLTPLTIFFAYYWQLGAFDTAWFHSFVVSSRYPKSPSMLKYLKFAVDFFLRFLPITLFFIYSLSAKEFSGRLKILGLLWSGLALSAVLIPGISFGHYFIQFMLPFCFVAGWIFGRKEEKLPRFLKWLFQPKVGYLLLGVLLSINFIFQKQDYLDKKDYPRIVAKYLQEKLTDEDQIYTGNFAHILYYLLDQPIPNKYVHPSLFWQEKHIQALEMDITSEQEKIKAQQPKYVLMKEAFTDNRFAIWLNNDYHLEKTFDKGRIKIYRRNE